jgi:hypothetical protein
MLSASARLIILIIPYVAIRALEREWMERALAAEARVFVTDYVSSYGASINVMRGDAGGTPSLNEFLFSQGRGECA